MKYYRTKIAYVKQYLAIVAKTGVITIGRLDLK